MIETRMLKAIFVIGTLLLPSVLSSVCVSQDNVFPNIGALGCESYFSCHDFVPHLHDCPQGYQFHYANLQCQPSGQVLCQWQRENFQQLYGAGGIPQEFYDRGYASDGLIDPLAPPPIGFIDPLAPPPIGFIDPLTAIDGSLNLPFPNGIIPPPLAAGPFLQPPPVGFLPRASMFPSLPAIDLSISVLARDLMEMLAPIAQSGSNQAPTLSISSPFAGIGINNAGFSTRTAFGNTGMQSNIPEYYPDPFFGQYTTNPLPLFSTINSIPRSGYIPGLASTTTIGIPYPIFMNMNNIPNSGFNNAFQEVPLPIFPLNNAQSGYIPRIASQYSPNTMTTSYPGVSTSVPSLGVIGSLFPINLQQLGLGATGQTSLGQSRLGVNGMTGMNGLSFPQLSNGFAGFTGTQSMATGTNMMGGSGLFSGIPGFGNFLNFTFPLFGSSGNVGFGGFGLGTPTYQSKPNGASFPLTFGNNFPVSSNTANSPFPSGLTNTHFGTVFKSPPLPVWNINTNQGSGTPLNTVPYPVNVNNANSNFVPRNGFPSGNFLGSTTFGSNPPTPLGFGNTGVSTAFTNQGSGYIPNGFNHATTIPIPLGFSNNPSGFANSQFNLNNVGYTPQTSLGSNAQSGSYFPPYPLANAGSNTSPSASNGLPSFGSGNGPVPLGFASTNFGGSVPNTIGYRIPSTSGSSTNAYTPNVSGYVPNSVYAPNANGYLPNTSVTSPNKSGYTPNTSGYVPNTSGYTPNTSGYVPNTSGYTPNTSGYVPNTIGYVPNSSGYAPNTSGYVPNSSGYAPNTSGYVPNSSGYAPNPSGYVPKSSGYKPNTSSYIPNTSGYVPTSSGYVPSGVSGNPSNMYPFNANVNRSGSVILGGFPGSSYNSNFYNPNSIGFTSNAGTGQLYVPTYGSNSQSNAHTNTGYAPNYTSNDHSNTATSSTGFGVVYPSSSASVAKSGGFQGFELGTLRSSSDSVNSETISKDRDFRSTPNDTVVANVASTSGVSATVTNGTLSVSAG